MVHAAVQVGPFLLHWFDTSLVYVKELQSQEALLAVDIGQLDITEERDVQKLKQVGKPLLIVASYKEFQD